MKQVPLNSFTELMCAYNHCNAYLDRALKRYELDSQQKQKFSQEKKNMDGENRFQRYFLLNCDEYAKYTKENPTSFKDLFNIVSDQTVPKIKIENVTDDTENYYEKAYLQLKNNLADNTDPEYRNDRWDIKE